MVALADKRQLLDTLIAAAREAGESSKVEELLRRLWELQAEWTFEPLVEGMLRVESAARPIGDAEFTAQKLVLQKVLSNYKLPDEIERAPSALVVHLADDGELRICNVFTSVIDTTAEQLALQNRDVPMLVIGPPPQVSGPIIVIYFLGSSAINDKGIMASLDYLRTLCPAGVITAIGSQDFVDRMQAAAKILKVHVKLSPRTGPCRSNSAPDPKTGVDPEPV
jgi:hypothetical protein